jgi:enoyl-CoA hydratase
MAKFEAVIYEADKGVGMITLDRPKALNALSYKMRDELWEALVSARDDREVGCLVITGGGDKAFCAGGDATEMRNELPAHERKEIMMKAHRVFCGIEALGKPVIAAVNGMALGGGMELAMACHLRTASEGAVFGQPEINLGMMPGYGGTQRLPRLVGRGRAYELLLTGGSIGAEEAHRIGLVNRVFPADELLPGTMKLAEKIAKKPRLAVHHIIESVNRGNNLDLDQALELEADLMVQVFGSEDAQEGLSAYLENRKPVFKNR